MIRASILYKLKLVFPTLSAKVGGVHFDVPLSLDSTGEGEVGEGSVKYGVSTSVAKPSHIALSARRRNKPEKALIHYHLRRRVLSSCSTNPSGSLLELLDTSPSYREQGC